MDLFQSCRRGDLDRVRYLVESGETELNLRDCWDSTPLYYACLCGHHELVEYLLQNGARCAPNTFDGERCLYAALTDKIRSLLKSYKAITSECMRRDSYREFLRRCLEDSPYADVCFIVHGVPLPAHRLILSARSSYFAKMFMSKWRDRPIIELKNKLFVFPFQQFPKQFPFEISSDVFDVSVVCDEPPVYSDVCFIVENHRFYCHKVFFCGRSDYFRALLDGHFSESTSPGKQLFSASIPEVYLNDVTPDVFAAVVAFIYQDEALVTEENVYNVLCFADIYLLSGLKRLCARVISAFLDTENVLTVFRTARLFNLPRLEVDCCEYMSKHLEMFLDNKEFHALILEDASSVRDRQQTDSIPVVDDIRFHLYKGVLPSITSDEEESGQFDSETKLKMLSDLLIDLGIEC
ncbi:ankyrin repeat and BTB/POZ domain-containing protein 1-like [Pocillopora damicornis]|uniref:ankyrin repeat and BTB/POZ domain-containing protein 1-like n=1 Tax=Pocillopora damicornis TaxID=46731 RepID=UPI000F551787|nr:ankyrin repeat and BTB/POZ domain-containing protein 1-like [Pocillopora damicornis]